MNMSCAHNSFPNSFDSVSEFGTPHASPSGDRAASVGERPRKQGHVQLKEALLKLEEGHVQLKEALLKLREGHVQLKEALLSGLSSCAAGLVKLEGCRSRAHRLRLKLENSWCSATPHARVPTSCLPAARTTLCVPHGCNERRVVGRVYVQRVLLPHFPMW